MEQVRYMISDAANLVGLEQHVLRYWEDELQLDVPRNEMGHRYYTEDNIKEFFKIKELKEKGYQLKAIRMYLKSEKQRNMRQAEKDRHLIAVTNARELGYAPSAPVAEPQQTVEPSSSRGVKLEQFQELMTEIVANAMKANNGALSDEIGDRILKEMNYLMQEHQELEEDRYRKLDAAIRNKRKPKVKAEKPQKQRKRWFSSKKEPSIPM